MTATEDRPALDTRRASLDDSRRALLDALAGRRAPGADGPRPGSPGDPAVLSFAQRRLWFVDQLHPGNPAYDVPLAVRLRGPLDLPALRAALAAVLERHTVLRSVYEPDDGGEARPRVLEHHLVTPLHDVADEAALEDLLAAETAHRFDLGHAVPVRTWVARLGPEDHVLMVNMHHIVTDGWSVRLLFGELEELYAAARRHRAPAVPELPCQYADVARWERERLAGPRRAELLEHWRRELDGAVPLELPTDRPRPAVFDHRGASRYLDVPDELVGALRRLGAADGVTLYMVLLAGFVATMARHGGTDDVVLGTSVAGRDHPAVSNLIGFFANTLPLRVQAPDDPTFRELMQRARRATLTAYAHQEMPFDVLVDGLDLPRDPSRPPLTSVMFLLDETPDTGPALDGLRVEPIDLAATSSKYDLMVNLHDTGRGVRALVEYPVALFDGTTVETIMRHFVTLLGDAVTDPDRPLSQLRLLDDDEQHALLDTWNDTATPLGHDICLHHLFEEYADITPDAVALVHVASGGGPATVGYRELEERANRLAHHLRALGVGPDRAVALALRRGPDLVVSVLAVLKAGGAFVPLDPDYPADRLALMLADSGAAVLVTVGGLRDRLPATDARIVLLDADADAIAARPRTRPAGGASGHDLAYVIFTSGSTGAPKGIALEHRGVVNNLLDLNLSHDVGPGDATLALSSPSFDMSVYEVLGVLGAGATLVLPDPAHARDPGHWVDLAVRFGVSVWNSAPAVLDLFLDEVEHRGLASLPRLRLAFLGGDWIPVGQPARVRAVAPGSEFVALGGATEASVHSIEFGVDRVDPAWAHIPYGRPMANQRAYVLDRWSRPVPVGVAGELHLGGEGLARGYLGRPALTAEKFVQVELRPGRVERLYRTGDVARYRRDGVLELLGRTDFRIKLNGLRVEPGEIEHALRARPGVREAVVVARESGGRSRLVAYVVADPGAAPDPGELRSALATTLPAFAVPAVIVPLPELPLSPNGKVDRGRLPGGEPVPVPAPRASGADPGHGADPVLDRVRAAWREVLGTTGPIGPDDDFFALGGDSFAAVRAVRAVAHEGLGVVDLFTHPTPRGLAHRIREVTDGRAGGHTLLHDLTRRGDRPGGGDAELTLVCFPHGGGDAITYRPLADRLPGHLALTAVSPPGHDPLRPGPMLPVAEFAALAAAEIVRTVRGPFAVYGHCAGVVAALECTRELERMGVAPEALHLAAALPETDPEWSVRMGEQLTDDDLVGHLRDLGGFDGVLDDRDLGTAIGMVRHDMLEAARFFLRATTTAPVPLTTPVHCILGTADSATCDDERGPAAWLRFARDVSAAEITDAGHYFARHLPDQLAAVLSGIHPRSAPPCEETS